MKYGMNDQTSEHRSLVSPYYAPQAFLNRVGRATACPKGPELSRNSESNRFSYKIGPPRSALM